MHSNHWRVTVRKSSLVLVMAILLFSMLYVAELPAARAEELPPITPTAVEPKTPPPGMEALANDVSIAATADTYEPDNSQTELDSNVLDVALTSGVAQTHSISPVGDTDWVKFQLATKSSITIETKGANLLDDTEMWLYNSSLQQLDYNDDKNQNNWHSYIQRCGPTALAAGTYYALIDKRKNDAEIASYSVTFTINPAGPTNCIPNTVVAAAGQSKGSYWVHPETTTRQSYAGLSAGPVKVLTYDKVKPLAASMGISLKKTAGYESYTEFIGVPGSRLTDTYIFPWYNYASVSGLVTQLCFGNVGGANTNVTVTIGTRTPIVYPGLGVNRARCVSYPGVSAGPVKVKSSARVLIVASLSSKMKTNNSFTSYAEFGGLSASDTYSTDYMFPWYNNLTSGTTVSFLRYTNVGSAPTNVIVLVHGIQKLVTNNLGPNQSKLIALSNLVDGPVHVKSSSNVPITVSMIVKLKNAASYASYTELMGLPLASPVDTRFVFPWYNNAATGNLLSQLRIVNLGAATNVTVTIGGVTMPYVRLLRGQSKVVTYTNVNRGPVVLQSSGGVPILASMITYLKKGTGFTSYSEYIGQLGLPKSQLFPTVWFPWYNNSGNFVSELRFTLPDKP